MSTEKKTSDITKRNPHSPIRGTDVPPKILKSVAKYRLDEHGRELHDPVPLQPPLGYKRTPSLAEQIRTMVRSEALKRAAQHSGMETFEEADDFDVGDDYDPSSPYEEIFDPTPTGPVETFEDHVARGVSRALRDTDNTRQAKTPEEAESLIKQGFVKVNEYFRKPPTKNDEVKLDRTEPAPPK